MRPQQVSLVRIQSGGLFLSEAPGRTLFPAFLPPEPACTHGFFLLRLRAGTSAGALLSSRPSNPGCLPPPVFGGPCDYPGLVLVIQGRLLI